MNATPYLDHRRFAQAFVGVSDEFQAEAHVVEVYQTNPSVCYFPFVNDAEQLKQKLLEYCASSFTGRLEQRLNYRQRILT